MPEIEDPAASAAPPSPGRVALLLGTLVALTVIGSSAVAVAIPVLAADLGLDTSGSAWILAAFSMAFAIATAVFGRLADVVGLRLPLRVGAVAFAAGSLLAAAAPSFPVLILGRVIQGAGAGAVPVTGVGIIAATYAEEDRGRALGAITAVVSIVSGSGPLIGGGITQLLGWRAVLALPAVALLLSEPVARLAPRQRPSGTTVRGFDVRGAVLVAVAVSGLVLLLQSPATGAGGAVAAAFAALLAGGGIALAAHVRARPAGFLPRPVIGSGALRAASATGLTLLAAYLATILAVPKLLTAGQGWTPLQIGLAMLPAAIIGAASARVVGGRARPESRHRIVALLGLGSAAGMALAGLAAAVPVLLVAGLALVAAGFGGGQVALIDAIPGMVRPEHRGVALGVFNLVFFVGGAVGTAAVGGLSGVLTLQASLVVVAALPLAGALLAMRARPA